MAGGRDELSVSSRNRMLSWMVHLLQHLDFYSASFLQILLWYARGGTRSSTITPL